jgi:hypothetical protein
MLHVKDSVLGAQHKLVAAAVLLWSESEVLEIIFVNRILLMCLK